MNEYPYSISVLQNLDYKTELLSLSDPLLLNGVMYVAVFVIPTTYRAAILPSALSVHTQDTGLFKYLFSTMTDVFIRLLLTCITIGVIVHIFSMKYQKVMIPFHSFLVT